MSDPNEQSNPSEQAAAPKAESSSDSARLLDGLRDSISRLGKGIVRSSLEPTDSGKALRKAIDGLRQIREEVRMTADTERRRVFESTLGQIEAQFALFKKNFEEEWARLTESGQGEHNPSLSIDELDRMATEFAEAEKASASRREQLVDGAQLVEMQFKAFTERLAEERSEMEKRLDASTHISDALEEIERTSLALKERSATLQALLDDDNADVSSLIRKRAELNELQAYLDGLKFAVDPQGNAGDPKPSTGSASGPPAGGGPGGSG